MICSQKGGKGLLIESCHYYKVKISRALKPIIPSLKPTISPFSYKYHNTYFINLIDFLEFELLLCALILLSFVVDFRFDYLMHNQLSVFILNTLWIRPTLFIQYHGTYFINLIDILEFDLRLDLQIIIHFFFV